MLTEGVSVNLWRETTIDLKPHSNLVGEASDSGSTISRASVAAAVPESETWAMMLVGFGAMGVAMRRRRRTLVLAQVT